MLRTLCAAHENRHFHVVADSAYGGQNVLAKLPGNCDGQACGSTFWRWPRAAKVPESWPDSSNTRSPWRLENDAVG
jgi:hypothetical protein